MARSLNRLTAREIATAKPGDRKADGGGLYLLCGRGNGETAPKSWAFFYFADGKRREIGLGGLDALDMKAARELAAKLRAAQAAGIDPKEERDRLLLRGEHAVDSAQADAPITFKAVALEYIASKRHGWRNPKHRQQWENTLDTYVYPIVGDTHPNDIDQNAVLRVLQPFWLTKPETASRVRGRMQSILGYATFKGYRTVPGNPAMWADGLQHALPSRAKVQRVEHHAALPYAKLPELMAHLAEQAGVGALALRFAILTAARTGEVIGARWAEVDIDAGVWTVPAARYKTGKEHRVTLSTAAVELLRDLPRVSEYVFPGLEPGRPLSNMAMLETLRRMAESGIALADGITVHGFRSTFKDWASEQTAVQWEVSEACLGHAVGDEVARAYGRSDFLDKRRGLMDAWARFACGGRGAEAGNVIRLGGRPAGPAQQGA